MNSSPYSKKSKEVVVMGGGTGIFPVTTALKHLHVAISTVIAVSDSGGSTGRIRDEFGFQPVGDLRQSLAALAEGENQQWIRKLLLYRFKKGNGLKGHNLGNLILTALQDMTKDTSQALKRAQQIFRLEGNVIPATKDTTDLKIVYEDGSSKIGEDYLNPESSNGKKVKKVLLTPAVHINPEAAEKIRQAHVIIIGPGDLYASLLATLIARGTKKAFAESKAKIIYVSNLMTRKDQTDDMSVGDHVAIIEKTIGKSVDKILVNNQPIPESTIKHYAASGEFQVENDLKNDKRLVEAAIISDQENVTSEEDKLHRSFLRHDSTKLQPVLAKMLK